jgi:hypothetical protein
MNNTRLAGLLWLLFALTRPGLAQVRYLPQRHPDCDR